MAQYENVEVASSIYFILEEWYIYYFYYLVVVTKALSSATKHDISRKFRRKVGNGSILTGTECRIARFPLPTVLSVGYSVKLK